MLKIKGPTHEWHFTRATLGQVLVTIANPTSGSRGGVQDGSSSQGPAFPQERKQLYLPQVLTSYCSPPHEENPTSTYGSWSAYNYNYYLPERVGFLPHPVLVFAYWHADVICKIDLPLKWKSKPSAVGQACDPSDSQG